MDVSTAIAYTEAIKSGLEEKKVEAKSSESHNHLAWKGSPEII